MYVYWNGNSILPFWLTFTRLDSLHFLGPQELNEVIRLIMYPSVIRNLFGESTLLNLNDEKSLQELKNKFVTFDDQFEYGTQIPQIFLG